MKQVFLLLILLLFTFTNFAQQKSKSNDKTPDFTGTWILDRERTDVEGGKGSIELSVDLKLVIEHKNPEIKITETTIQRPNGEQSVREITFLIDGQRRSVSGKMDANNFVIYKWKGKTLVKTAKFVIKREPTRNRNPEKFRNDTVKIENREEWQISKDGKTLTQRLIDESPNDSPIPFSPVTIFVFRRQD